MQRYVFFLAEIRAGDSQMYVLGIVEASNRKYSKFKAQRRPSRLEDLSTEEPHRQHRTPQTGRLPEDHQARCVPQSDRGPRGYLLRGRRIGFGTYGRG